jgi:hypothetical protein
MNALFPFAIVGAFAAACADGTLPARTARNPSNPDAPETPPPGEVSPAARPTANGDAGGPSPPAPAVYPEGQAPASANSGASH